MRGSVRIKGSWQNVTLSEDEETLTKWLWAHDGKEAVCIDDKKQVYYCATEALREQYQKGGKKALMFYDLGAKLHSSSPAVDPSLNNPFWCATYAIICSAADECTDDCCYQPRG